MAGVPRDPTGRAQTTILIADDVATNRELLLAFLDSHRIELLFAHNGREAVELARASAPRLDLILMDIRMPQMDGIEAARRIREIPGLRTCPIIGLSAADADEEQERCEGLLDAYLTKPFGRSALLRLIAKLLDRSLPLAG